MFLTPLIMAAGFYGRFENVPEEARAAAQSGLVSPIVNGLNFQGRIDVRLIEISNTKITKLSVLPVAREYRFEAQDLDVGEYELSINAYDFNVPSPRYRLVVGDSIIEAFEDKLGSVSYNVSSKQTVTRDQPLLVDISGFKEYYETPEGKLTEMLMSSPLGVIFRSTFYSTLFFGTLAIIAFPYIIPYVAPDFAQQYQQMQAEINAEQSQGSAAKPKEEIAEKNAIRASRAKQRR